MRILKEKAMLRQEFLSLRKSLSSLEQEKLSAEITAKLKTFLQVQNASSILSYKCMGSEVNLDPFNLEMQQSGKKVFYPQKTSEFTKKNVDVAIIPAVAFDILGDRLGRGGGFYDELLPKLNCLKIGVAFDLQVVDKLPFEAHDAKVDVIVTEKRIIRL